MMCSRKLRRQYQEPDLPLLPKSSATACLEPPNIHNREKLLQHLFTPQELLSYQRNGKMHILRNIPQSTLGYFCGESLISINENEISRAELVEIAKREFNKYNNLQADVFAIEHAPIAVGYHLVKEDSIANEQGIERPFKTFIMPSSEFHVKFEDIFMYDDQGDNYLLPGERHLKANPFWLPYYPWMWFA